MLFVDFAKQEQSGIGADVATGEIGLNLAAREWQEDQFFRYRFEWRPVVLFFVCRNLKS